jgi:hypothetical protein
VPRELWAAHEGQVRSLGVLFSEETSTLIRHEAALRQEAVSAGRDAGFIVVGGQLVCVDMPALIATDFVFLMLTVARLRSADAQARLPMRSPNSLH